jgi:hypothetical protein
LYTVYMVVNCEYSADDTDPTNWGYFRIWNGKKFKKLN